MNSTTRSSRKAAFTLVGLLVIIAVLGILAAMLIPALVRAKGKSKRIQCINNLKQDGLAFRLWDSMGDGRYPMAVSTNKGGTMEFAESGNTFRHFQVMSNELNTPKILVCPDDNRTAATSFAKLNNQNVSYFVGLDAEEARPQMLMTGDRNVTKRFDLRAFRARIAACNSRRLDRDHAQWKWKRGHGGWECFSAYDPHSAKCLRNTGNTTNRIALPE